MTHIGKRYLYGIVTMALTLASGTAYGFSPERYAASSRLASGRWAKIRVNETGMQLITTAQLRNLGFSDPSKVRVYGYGGRMISETLDLSHHDDLPLLPSVVTTKGVVFFGVDRTSWNTQSNASAGTKYERTQNPYSLYSYYFISDAPADSPDLPVMQQGVSSSPAATTFTAHLIHEQEMQAPYISGRRVYGEDFRAQTSQAFPFVLTGSVNSDVKVYTVFGASTTTSGSSFTVTANGSSPLSGSGSKTISALTDNIMFREEGVAYDFAWPGEKLSVGVRYNPGGAVSMARLDYITVEYERQLSMSGVADLHFYDVTTAPKTYTLSGCTSNTVIWDVTDPGSPQLVEAQSEGDRLTFTSSAKGYREYVAFEAEKVSRAVAPAGAVASQDIHALPVPDMVIIAPEQYTAQARRIAAIHEDIDRWRVHVLTPEAIYNEFSSGTPDAGAFRKALKMWYDRGTTDDGHRLSHCLIISRPTYDNLGVSQAVKGLSYPRVPMWQDYYGSYNNKEYSFGTDDYIVMLEDGESMATSNGQVNNTISIAVGRMPVKSVAELTTMVDKLERYLREPQYGSWLNRGVILADDQDSGVHMDQADKMYQYMQAEGSRFEYKRIYTDTYDREASGRGYQYPAAKEELMRQLNDGVATWTYVGHGGTTGLSAENMFNWTDVNSMTNTHPFIMYAPTCEFMRWDDDDISGGEVVWLYPDAGAIAMMIASRSVLINGNGYLSEAMGKHWFNRDADGRGLTIGELLRRGKNTSRPNSTGNRLRFAVMGDPAIRMPAPGYQVVVDSINGIAIGDGELPEFGANDRMTIAGHIEDWSGTPADDFNGEVEVVLYDAERVVQAKGNGDDDKAAKYAFNMRVSTLNKMRETVTDGKWTSTMLVPSIIDNNYSPARLSMYAYGKGGVEANGACEQFYIYGEGSTTITDDKGPEIELLALNSESFTPGDIVNESPLVLARFRDESGINVYGGVIGQQLSISIDGTSVSGVSDYYTPALADHCAGSLLMPLSDLEPGDHQLTLTVFDMAGNFSEETIPFRVAIGRAPSITDITTDVNPATTSVNFILTHDRPSEVLDCTIEVFDLSGRKVWSTDTSTGSNIDSKVSVNWNLCDGSGARVARGIYLYRATVTTADGTSSSKTRKLAVTAR